MTEVLNRLGMLVFDRRTRIMITVIFLAVALAITALGVVTVRMERSEAQEQADEIEEMLGQYISFQFIFGNNLFHTLVMFIPVAGPVWGAFVLFNTGNAIAVISISEGIQPVFAFLLLSLVPVFWMEFMAYSIAMAQSFIWLLKILRRKGRREAVATCILIAICTVILLFAAVIEIAVISASAGLCLESLLHQP